MGHEKTRILSLAIFFLCLFLLVNLFLIQDYEYTPPDNISVVLSNSLTASNSSWQSSLPLHLLPENDSSHLMNITHFKFLINPACSESQYVVCVHSAPGNHIKRQLIRKTWGAHVPVYFFLGNTTPDQQTHLDTESREFHDLVQGNFNDSYRNLTYKHTMVFKWVVYHCPHIKYILKCDDDMFINVVKLNDFLTHSLSPHGTQNLLMCPLILYHEMALRSYRSKWRVTFKEYPDHYYPPHCHGTAILYSPDIIFKLYQLLQKEQKYFWIDDVFITGVVFANLNITHSNFDWWLGNKKSLLIVNTLNNLDRFDPNKNLFVYLNNSKMKEMKDMFRFLSNATSAPALMAR